MRSKSGVRLPAAGSAGDRTAESGFFMMRKPLNVLKIKMRHGESRPQRSYFITNQRRLQEILCIRCKFMQSDCASERENRAKALEKERVRRYHVDIENENLPEGTLHMKFGIEGGSPDSISQYRPINTDNS